MDVAKGRASDILVIRLCRGEDLTESIYQACERYGIRNAAIVSMVGSLKRAVFYDPRPDERDPSGVAYGDPIYVEYPAELLSGNGEICHRDDGSLSLHVHAVFADSQGRAFGGHIMGPGNETLNTLNIFLQVIDGVDMGFAYDPVLEIPAFHPVEREGGA